MGKFLHDDRFKHVSYHETNLQKTFARIRAKAAAEQKQQKLQDDEAVRRLHVVYPNLPRKEA